MITCYNERMTSTDDIPSAAGPETRHGEPSRVLPLNPFAPTPSSNGTIAESACASENTAEATRAHARTSGAIALPLTGGANEPSRTDGATATQTCEPALESARTANTPAETIRLRKVATALRTLETWENDIEFRLVSCMKEPHEDTLGAFVYEATCSCAPAPELERCVIKLTKSRELAHNEWDHLTNYRSPIFPTPFLLGRTEDGRRAVVMELVEGPTLQSLINAGFGEDRGCASVERALEIISPLAASFKVLSLDARGFVHRDIKPANIVITRGSCRTRLIDLGISAHERDLLQHRHVGATPGFAPPEIADPARYPADAPLSLCDARIDAYSLSATLFTLLTGTPPRTYGATLHAGDLRHDEGVINAVRIKARANIQTKHKREVDDQTLDALVARALRAQDTRLAGLVTRGLSYLQHKRPTPAEFFDELPQAYVHTIVDAVHVLYLESLASEAVHPARIRTVSPLPGQDDALEGLADTPLSDEYRYEGFLEDFREAMDCWNKGDYARAVPLFHKLDAAGDPTAQYNLGICYRDALGGLSANRVRMLACWTKAAEAGHVVAAFNVARCHERGDGIPVTPKAARMWYLRSAEGGYPEAAAWVRAHPED